MTEVAVEPGNPAGRLRDLGAYERFRVTLHNLGFHYNVAVVGIYKLPEGTSSISRNLIFNVLREAIRRHPALSVTVAGNDSDALFFRPLETINLSDIVTFRDVPAEYLSSLEEFLSEENSRGFEYGDRPLWRAVVLNGIRLDAGVSGSGIAFIYHHLIADGKSGLALHSTILEAMNSMPSEESAPLDKESAGVSIETIENGRAIAVPRPERTLLPAMEDILSLQVSTKTKIWEAIRPWWPVCFSKWRNRNKWAGSPYHCEKPIRTKIRLIEIPSQVTRRLVERCRRERTRITAFLQIIVGRALMETFTSAERLRCAVAISLRRFFPLDLHIDDAEMGLWVDGFYLDCPRKQLIGNRDERVAWNTARKYSRRIDYEIRKGPIDLHVRSVQNIKDFTPGLMGQINKPRLNSYSITNIGLMAPNQSLKKDENGQQTWQLHQLFFSQSSHVNGSAIQICIVSTAEGGMAMSLNWQDATMLDAEADSLVVRLREVLLEIGNE